MRAQRTRTKRAHKAPAHHFRLRDRNIFIREPLPLEAPQELLGISNDQLGTMYQIANQLLDQEASTDAVRAFTVLCRIHPYVSDFWYGLGRALRACGQHDEALSMILTAETMDPSRFEFYRESIDCCLACGRKNEAAHIFRRLRAHRRSIEDFSFFKSEMKKIESLLRNR